MSNNISSNRLLRIRVEHSTRAAIDLSDDLICDDDRDSELIRQALQHAHELGEMRLPRGKLAAAREVGAVKRGCAIDDEEGEAGLAHHVGRLIE